MFNQAITYFSSSIMPVTILIILVYGVANKVNLYESFLQGIDDGVKTFLTIAPTILSLLFAVAVLNSSGFFDLLSIVLVHIVPPSIPVEIIPFSIIRLISSSASLGLMLDIFEKYGTDTFTGRFISTMMSSTETILYTMSVYFLSIKVTKTRYTLPIALFINISGIFISYFIVKLIFY